jgi:hypothetical protein
MPGNSNNYGAFIPTTQVWDVSEIYQTEVTSPAFKELLVRLYQNLNNISMNLNIKSSGFYHTDEFVTGDQFPPSSIDSANQSSVNQRQVYRKLINFGALPNTGIKSVVHGLTITPSISFTRIYGASSDSAGLLYLPLPYASATAADVIELWVDATNVNILTTSDQSAYTITYVILEYLKN